MEADLHPRTDLVSWDAKLTTEGKAIRVNYSFHYLGHGDDYCPTTYMALAPGPRRIAARRPYCSTLNHELIVRRMGIDHGRLQLTLSR